MAFCTGVPIESGAEFGMPSLSKLPRVGVQSRSQRTQSSMVKRAVGEASAYWKATGSGI